MKFRTGNIIRLLFAAIIISALFVCAQAQTKKRKQKRRNWETHRTEVIDYAKKYPVSKLEINMPQVSFEKWFRQTVGETKKIDWEINDCGEQTGTSEDRGRDFPMCVEASAVKAESVYIRISIQFGTFKRGITRMKPNIRSITVGGEIGGEWLDNLGDLPEKLKELQSK